MYPCGMSTVIQYLLFSNEHCFYLVRLKKILDLEVLTFLMPNLRDSGSLFAFISFLHHVQSKIIFGILAGRSVFDYFLSQSFHLSLNEHSYLSLFSDDVWVLLALILSPFSLSLSDLLEKCGPSIDNVKN